MRKYWLSFISILLFAYQPLAKAADLLEVYRQALTSDPIYQQAIAQRFSTQEGVPINLAALLPNIVGQITPSVSRQGFSGSYFQTDANTGAPLSPRNNTQRAYQMTLTATQTVFDFAKFSNMAGALSASKGADATLNAALQNLRTSGGR